MMLLLHCSLSVSLLFTRLFGKLLFLYIFACCLFNSYYTGMMLLKKMLFFFSKLIAHKMQSGSPRVPAVPLKSCLLLNISQCDVSEHSDQFVVTVYNPLGYPVSYYVRVPVSGASYTVQDPAGKQLKIQLVPIPQPVIEVPGRVSPATLELVFYAKDLPPLGFRSYYISKSNYIHHIRKYEVHHGMDVIVGNSVSQQLLQSV